MTQIEKEEKKTATALISVKQNRITIPKRDGGRGGDEIKMLLGVKKSEGVR